MQCNQLQINPLREIARDDYHGVCTDCDGNSPSVAKRSQAVMSQNAPSSVVTDVLLRVSSGVAGAHELLPLVYDELRRVAASIMRDRRPGQTLQPTALVHEAYVKLVGSGTAWESRAHFFAVAAMAMRQVLSNHVRAKQAEKREGSRARVTLHEPIDGSRGAELDILVLNEALERLAELDPRQCRIVEQRVLGGMTHDEIAHVLGVSTRTVEREWRVAQAWLSAFLRGSEDV